MPFTIPLGSQGGVTDCQGRIQSDFEGDSCIVLLPWRSDERATVQH